jgi:hypothetical protein
MKPVVTASRLSQTERAAVASGAGEPYPCPVLFVLGTLAVLAFIVGVVLLVGHYYPGSSGNLVDWVPTRSPEVEAQNEIDDVRQMLEAQNEMRRRRGARELTEADVEARVIEDERWKSRMHRGL